jgi:hypothetical protein
MLFVSGILTRWAIMYGMQMDALQELAENYYEIPRLDDIRDDYEFDVS